jgi:iron complex outermembrane receptor protein
MNKNAGDFLLWNGEDEGYVPLDTNVTVSNGINFYIDPHVSYFEGKHFHDLKARYFDINNESRSGTQNYDNFSEMLYMEYQYQYRAKEGLTWTAGSMFNGLHSDGSVFGGEHRSRNISFYGQLDQSLGRLNYSIGIRYEYFELDGWSKQRPVFRSGLNYQVFPGGWFRASFGQGFRYPSISEKYTFTSVGSVFVYPNALIQPEYGFSAEVGYKQGLKLGKWKGYADLAVFLMRYEDMMEFTFGLWEVEEDGQASAQLGFTSINIGPARMQGAEFTLIGEGEIKGTHFRLISGYTYMDPQILYPDSVYSSVPLGGDQYFELNYKKTSSDTSGMLKYRYNHLLKLDLQADRGRWGAGLSIRYNSFMKNIDLYLENLYGIKEARERLNQGDLIFDLRIQYHINEQWRLAFLIDNLLNREYMPRPAMYGPPRTFSIQLNAQI